MPYGGQELIPLDDSDEGLLGRMVRENDQIALGCLMRRHLRLMWWRARRLLPDASDEDIEEVIDDTFLSAWKKRRDYDSTRASVKTWLGLLLVAQATARRRTLQRIAAREQAAVAQGRDEAFLQADDLEASIDAAGRTARLQDALQLLGEDEQRLLLLRYGSELTTVEIARRLEISPVAVRVRLLRLLRRLRKYLGD
jgi:RNA polymerase sigma-70 factor (ECF subfamily)